MLPVDARLRAVMKCRMFLQTSLACCNWASEPITVQALGDLQRAEVYLAHGFGDRETQGQEPVPWAGPSAASACSRKWEDERHGPERQSMGPACSVSVCPGGDWSSSERLALTPWRMLLVHPRGSQPGPTS